MGFGDQMWLACLMAPLRAAAWWSFTGVSDLAVEAESSFASLETLGVVLSGILGAAVVAAILAPGISAVWGTDLAVPSCS